MSWLRENSFLAGLVAATLVVGSALVFLMTQSMTQYQDALETYAQAVRKLHALQNRSPFPNAENFQKSRALAEQHKSELDSLRAQLAKMQEQGSADVQPQRFQDDLRTRSIRSSKKASAAGVACRRASILDSVSMLIVFPTSSPRPLWRDNSGYRKDRREPDRLQGSVHRQPQSGRPARRISRLRPKDRRPGAARPAIRSEARRF